MGLYFKIKLIGLIATILFTIILICFWAYIIFINRKK